MSLKKAAAFLKSRNNFLITTHTNMEGDALGSALSLYKLLKALGKNASVMNEDTVPYEYSFLPEVSAVRRFNKKNSRAVKFDCLAAVDCSDLKRTGEVYTLNKDNKPVLNIDHHVSNVYFGSVNWVDPTASSCSQMIYELYKKCGVPIDMDSALLLYVGIVTDTGSFRYSNTSSKTHRIVADLLKYKFDIPQIYKRIYENVPFQDMKLLSAVLPTIKRELGGKLVWYEIKKELLRKQKDISFDLTEHILTFARSIKGVEAAILFKENLKQQDEIRVNFRSQGKVDVNEAAKFFGGGGHRTASGCTVKGKLQDVRKQVLRKLRRAFRK